MGSPIREGIGAIIFVCANCGRIYLKYMIGDSRIENKAKYGGVPSPKRALSGYDNLVCDTCNRKLHLFPVKIKIMSIRKFNRLFRIAADKTGREFLVLRGSPSLVKNLIEASHNVMSIEPGVASGLAGEMESVGEA